jgi:hypothetical protein
MLPCGYDETCRLAGLRCRRAATVRDEVPGGEANDDGKAYND